MNERKAGGCIQRFGAMVGVVLVGLALLAGIGYGLWRAMLLLHPGIVAAWALLATISLPIAMWGAWYFGHTEVRGWLAGADKMIDRAFGTATEALKMRKQATEAPVVSEIRLPEIIEVPALSPGRERVIDL